MESFLNCNLRFRLFSYAPQPLCQWKYALLLSISGQHSIWRQKFLDKLPHFYLATNVPWHNIAELVESARECALWGEVQVSFPNFCLLQNTTSTRFKISVRIICSVFTCDKILYKIVLEFSAFQSVHRIVVIIRMFSPATKNNVLKSSRK